MPISLRANLLKAEVAQVYKTLIHEGVEIQPVSWYASAFIVHNKSTSELTQLQSYKDGLFYIQNLSSMLPVLALDPQPEEKILDLCAAPGSKTTQIASETFGKSLITAVDISRDRLYKLKAILEKQNVTNVQILNTPGEFLWKKYPDYFDKVLVDAPCSMEQGDGTQEKRAKILAQKQKYLLRSAVSCCRPGGTIIYSTCSITRVENEENIDWILSKEPDKVICEYAVRVWPDELAEGFFLAKLIRK